MQKLSCSRQQLLDSSVHFGCSTELLMDEVYNKSTNSGFDKATRPLVVGGTHVPGVWIEIFKWE